MRTAAELSLLLENKPRTLAAILADFKKQHVNLEAIGSAGISTRACLFLRVSDVPRAKKVLER